MSGLTQCITEALSHFLDAEGEMMVIWLRFRFVSVTRPH